MTHRNHTPNNATRSNVIPFPRRKKVDDTTSSNATRLLQPPYGHPAPVFPNPMSARQAYRLATTLNAFLTLSEQLALVSLIGETGETNNISALTHFIRREQHRLGVFAPQDAPAWQQHLHHHIQDLMAREGC
ncbi:MAG: hypothetical protein ACPG1C_08575 [Alphaproteobacteria bacterium]